MVGKAFITCALLNAITGVSAFWRMECHGRSGLARIDPLVDPDRPSTHVHALHGSSALSPFSSNADLMAGNCTSCAVKQDMSAYWHPALYFRDAATGEFELVPQIGGMLAYYLQRNQAAGGKVKAFPAGFNMLAGSTHRRQFTLGDVSKPDPPTSSWPLLDQQDLEQRAIGFNCMNYDQSRKPEDSLYRHFMPDKTFMDANCKDGIRLEIMFPSCWDGKNVDSADHKSHMAYPNLVQDGTCPDGFPVRLPTLFYEVIWSTTSELFEGRDGEFVLSNGDPTGFGYHADFMSGWDVDFLQEALDRCTNDSGRIQDCPVFIEHGPLQTEPEQRECFLENPDPTIDVEVELGIKLAALPGNPPIIGSGADAPPEPTAAPETSAGFWDGFTSVFGIGGGNEATTTPSSSTTPTSAPTLSYSPAPENPDIPGGAFIESTSAPTPTPTPSPSPPPSPAAEAEAGADIGIEAVPPAPPAPTTTPPPEPVVTSEPGVSYEVVSTEILTEGNQVKEVVWKEAVVYVTEDVVTTTTVSVAPPVKRSESPLKARRQHWLRHQQYHGRRA